MSMESEYIIGPNIIINNKMFGILADELSCFKFPKTPRYVRHSRDLPAI